MPNPGLGDAHRQEGSRGPSELTREPLRASRAPEWDEPERPAVSDWASALSWGGDESELVNELQAGSETAFDWLVTHYHGPVYNLILSMLGDVSDAADGTQEVFLKAFRGIRHFRQGSSLKTWLYRIAIREGLNHKRRFKRHNQKNVSIDAEPEEGHSTIEIEDLGATPFEKLAAREVQVAVHEALQRMPGGVQGGGGGRVGEHLEGCGFGREELERYRKLSALLSQVPRSLPPADLAVRIRVAAAQSIPTQDLPSRLQRMRDRAEILLDNVFRPMTGPATGGFFSAILVVVLWRQLF